MYSIALIQYTITMLFILIYFRPNVIRKVCVCLCGRTHTIYLSIRCCGVLGPANRCNLNRTVNVFSFWPKLQFLRINAKKFAWYIRHQRVLSTLPKIYSDCFVPITIILDVYIPVCLIYHYGFPFLHPIPNKTCVKFEIIIHRLV